MAATNAKIEVGIKNENAIRECIQAFGNISPKHIGEATGLSAGTVSKYLKKIKNNNEPNYVFTHGMVSYLPDATDTENPSEKPERYPDHKNDEGYNDPTAAKAIKTVDGCLEEGPFKPGDVWLVSYVNGSLEKFLVIKAFDKTVSCLKIHTLESTETYNPVIHAPVSMQNKEIVDCRRVVAKPAKYFLEKDCNYNITNFYAIKRKIGLLLDICVEVPIEKEVPKEVIKEVIKEVPKEVIKEVIKEVPGPVEVKEIQVIPNDLEMEMALLKQKAEIYERITWAMLYNNNAEESS